MPSIKDESTVQAIAREFTSNGRSKLEALKTIGYKPSYYNTLGIGVVYSNIRVQAAIKVIDDKTEAKSVANRQRRQEFWTNIMDGTPTFPVTAGDKLRASELLGRSECDFIEKTINLHADIPSDPAQYKLWLQKELAKLEDSKKVIESYEKSTDALAKRY